MKTVYKYEIPVEDEFVLSLPKGAELLAFQNQAEVPTLWALVDPKAKTELRHFLLRGTGHPVEDVSRRLEYVGTAQFQGGRLVWHLFEFFEFGRKAEEYE